MRIILDLPQELERELSLEAAQLGLPLAEYVLRLLATGRIVGNIPKTGAELLAYWQNEGLIGTRPDIADSQKHAREIRAAAEKRTRA
jgi:hypothetical protein